MEKSRLNLKYKLMLSFSMATLIGFGTLGVTSYLFSEKLLKQLVADRLETQIKGVETTIRLTFDENLQRAQGQMNHWSKEFLPKLVVDHEDLVPIEAQNQATNEKVQTEMPRLNYEGKPLEGNQVVDRLAALTDDAVTFFVSTPEGLLRVSTSIRKPDGSRAVGTLIPKTSPIYQQLMEGKRYVGRAQVFGNLYMSVYEPLIQNKQVVGAFFLGVPETSSEKIRSYLKEHKIFKTGYYFIMNHEGKMILHPSKEGKIVTDQTDLDGKPIFKEIMEKKNGWIEYNWLNAETKKPQPKLALFKFFPEMDWYVAASFNKEEAEEILGSLRRTIALITSVGVLAMFVLSFIYGQKISRSLQALSVKLLTITEETTHESEDLSRSSQTLSGSASEAAASLEETVASLEEINSQVQNNLQMTAETNTLGQKSLHTARISEEKLRTLTQFMHGIQQDSKRIQEISSLIDDIAFQTNLLSLNAAVEAARAGEHGKGFAVVADAVRSLAAKSAESARQITSTIDESSDRIQKVVHAGEEVNSSFREIVDSIQKFSALVSEITQSSQEQASGISQINKAMNQLDSTTQSNSQLADTISTASSQLSDHSLQLRQAVTELDKLINGGSGEAKADPPSEEDRTGHFSGKSSKARKAA